MRLLTAIAIVALAQPASADTWLNDLARSLEGTFVAEDDSFEDQRQRIPDSQLGDVVFYLEIRQGTPREVYRQRMLVLTTDPDSGDVLQTAYPLETPERYVASTTAIADYAAIGATDIGESMGPGCVMRWSKREDAFYGRIDPVTCSIVSSRTGKVRQIGAEAMLDGNTLRLAERGFDPDSGEQLFGTEPGEWLSLERAPN